MSTRQIESIYPLSPSQRGIYFESLGLRDPALHIEQAAITLRGELDAAQLQQAWQSVVDRQPMLRTGFAGRDLDRPMQVVYRAVQAETAVHDLTDEADPRAAADRLLAADHAAGFALARPPLIRLALFKFGPREHRLAWTHHHILMDGWCISLLMRDLFAAYRAAGAALPPAPTYQDYIRWLRRQDAEEAKGYWREHLAGFRQPTQLGEPIAPLAEFSGHNHGHLLLRLGADRSEALARVARQQRVTQGAVVQAAWAGLLGRYSGSRDVLFGVTVAGRSPELDGIEEMVGMFATALPLRVALDPDEPMASLLMRLHALRQAQQPYEAFGGGQIHDSSELPGSWPLYESLVTVENYPVDPAALGGDWIVAEPASGRSHGAHTRHALVLLVTLGRELELELVYDRRRFDEADATGILNDAAALLGAIAEDPEIRLTALWAQLSAAPIPHVRPGPWQIADAVPASVAAVPRTPGEAQVARIFAEVLGVTDIGQNRNFFDCGGHSLLATQAIARLSEALGRALPLRLLFDNPTVAGLASALERDGSPASATGFSSVIPAAPRDRPIALTPGQERLWFLDRLGEARSAYCEQGAVELEGPLDAAVLERCLAALVQRHEPLRTTFVEVDGRPMQVVGDGSSLPFVIDDHTDRDREGQEAKIRRVAGELAAQPFDLQRGPLFRITLFRLGTESHVLLLSIHHIITDGWSHSILFRELAVLYDAFSAEIPSPLPPLSIQFGDYAEWQRQRLDAADMLAALRRRTERLRGAPPRSGLSPDWSRPASPADRGACVSRVLSPAQRDELLRQSADAGCTLFMALLAAFAALLRRHGGQDDVLIGVPFSGRERSQLEHVFGFFINTLVVRADLSGNPSFRELLARVRDETLDVFASPELPFERLVETVGPERSAGVNPLFQVFINMLSHPPVDVRLGRLSVAEFPLPRGAPMFDLTLYVIDRDGLRLDLVYNPALFAASRMQTLLDQFEALLSAVAIDPDIPIDACPLTANPIPAPDPLPHAEMDESTPLALFEAQTRLSPNRTALIGRDGAVSLAELDAAAHRLATQLARGGVRPGDTVAIYAQRGAALIQAMLGVHKAGAAFTILDPAYPPARLLACMREAAPAAWIALEQAGAPPPELASAAAALRCSIVLAPLGATFDPASDTVCTGSGADALHLAAAEPRPDDPAYIAFTSGTTGIPRGIRGTHRPVAHFLGWYRRRFALGADDRFALLSGLAHDPLLRDVFTPLAVGATLCIPDARDLDSPERLLRWLDDNAITVVHLSPALAQALCALEGGCVLPRLRLACFGGDRLVAALVRRLRALAPNAVCLNCYGATETPQIAACHEIADDPGDDGAVVPIGQGIDGVQLLVLNGAGNPAVPFEMGEICVRSRYLASALAGVDRHPDGFAPDPFGNDPEIRIYRTGDLGRIREDCAVEFLGRRDRQVKIRGFRVELGEVEHCLLEHPAVRQVAVVMRGDADAAPIAYWTGEPAAAEDLRGFLSSRLPSFMVPAGFVHLEALPRTPNGKLDPTALPEAPADCGARDEPPRDSVEQVLCTLFSEVLSRGPVGIHDDFFACGGHSLRAMQLVSRIHRDLGIELPLRMVFAQRTVAALAAALRDQAPGKFAPIAVAGPAQSGVLSYAERRLWLLDRLEPGAAAAYSMSDALLLEGALQPDRIEAALRAVVQRHESLRTIFEDVDGTPRRVVRDDIDFRCPVIDLSQEADPRQRAREYADGDVRQGFRLAEGPLLRITLLRIGPSEHVLLFCAHHIVSDWWSTGILVRDFLRAYALADGPPVQLPPLRVQYRDYAAWQADRVSTGALDADRRYWLEKLAGDPAPLDLPTDFPRSTTRAYRGAVLRARFAGAARELSALGEARGASLFMVLVAVVKVLFHRLTAQEEIVLGVPVAGRNHIDLEDQIGCFINMLVLRDRIAGDAPFATVLDAVRCTATEAFDHQAYPFDLLIEDLKSRREPGRSPLFDVALMLQQGDKTELSLPGLLVSRFDQTHETAKYDMRLVFEQIGDDLELDLEYDSGLFLGDRVARLAGQFGVLVGSVVGGAECRVDGLAVLPGWERREVLAGFAGSGLSAAGSDECMHTLVAASAARDPAGEAVREGGAGVGISISYGALMARCDRLAARLRRFGIGPEVVVAQYLPRSIAQIVGLLAILKAGGVYLPLEVSDPLERTARLLDDSGAPVVLTSPALEGALPSYGGQVLYVDDDAGDAEPESVDDAVNPDGAAYLIYTSGSTGAPKGALLTHRGFVSMIGAQIRAFAITPTDRVLQFASVGFDASLSEIFMALGAGACLVVAPEASRGDPAALREVLRAERVSVATLPPPLLRQLGAAGPGGLRLLVTAGEAAPVAEVTAAARGMTVWNAYGPTEASVCATMQLVSAEADYRLGVPIGRPVDGVEVLILRGDAPVPIGVDGEICLGGVVLARGYVGQPGLTAEHFVPHPWRPGERLYRTGDIGRWRADGAVDYVGRLNHEVKVRGHRVSPGEVERVMLEHPLVGQAWVSGYRETGGEGGLCGYYAAGGGLELWPSLAEFFVYDRLLYGAMAGHRERNERYRAAFAKVLAGRTVVEIGPGPEAILARLCLEAGARRVYCIELLRETYEQAARTVRALGLADRIVVLHGDVRTVSLPEPADYCVSEIVGSLGGAEGAALLINAARRLLRPGGGMIPARAVTRLAAVSLPEGLELAFPETAAHYVEQVFAQKGYRFDLRLCLKHAARRHLLSSEDVLEDLDFTREVATEASHAVELRFTRDGAWHGFLAWLELHTDASEVLDTLDSQESWLPVYLPLSLAGLSVSAGDVFRGRVERRLSGNGLNPDYRVEGVLERRDGPAEAIALVSRHDAPVYRGSAFYRTLFAGEGVPVSRPPEPAELRAYLARRLPRYMVPGRLVRLARLPLTTSGKVDRAALPAAAPPETAAETAAAAAEPPRDAVEAAVAAIWREVLEGAQVGIRDNFFDAGGHSLRLVQVHQRLEARFGSCLTPVELFQFPTIEATANLIRQRTTKNSNTTHTDANHAVGAAAPQAPATDPAAGQSAIAIIGMSGRFPGAPDIRTLWENLCNGVESVRFFTDRELRDAGIAPETLARPDYVRAKPVLDDVAGFDAGFFGMTQREAEITDPQHRLFLETAWNTLEDAGYAPSYPGRIGVFAGCSTNAYLFRHLLPNIERLRGIGDYPLLIGNDPGYLATRVAYKLNLRGPAVTIGTACSTSLVAVDLACQALRTGTAEMALAGGVSLKVPQIEGYEFQPGGILSPDGHCRPFDVEAGGTIGGNGVAAVLLKPLDRALRDGDHIYAVIRASATNNDGAAKVGFTAPSVEGQAAVIRACLEAANIDAGSIGYVEAHGTGTPLGDPIEIAALSQAFAAGGTCAPGAITVGSVKSNFGHLDAAAGVTGLIKATLALVHGLIPPTVHFTTPNPHIDFANSPFRVSSVLSEWPAGSGPRRAGVSSFGIGGTNAHVLLEEAPPQKVEPATPEAHLLVLSAKTSAALDSRASDLVDDLRCRVETADSELPDIAFTLQAGREALPHRRALVCSDTADAVRLLRTADPASMQHAVEASNPRVAFLFPGQGSLRVGGSAAELYRGNPAFRELIDDCCERLRPHVAIDPRAILCPKPGESARAELWLQRTSIAQPALFVLEYALAQLLQSHGIQPAAMLGHSLGELVAATVAGVFSLDDALALIAERGRLAETMPPGAMLAVATDETTLSAVLDPALDIAAINGPDQCVVSGPPDVIADFTARLSRDGVLTYRLPVVNAFHGRGTDPLLADFTDLVARTGLRTPTVPYLSNVTGTWISAVEALDAAYYARHLRSPVRFHDGLSTLLADPDLTLVELGPSAALARLAQRHPDSDRRLILSALDGHDGEAADTHFLRALGRLWVAGLSVDFTPLHHGRRPRRVALPGYRFEHTRHWIDLPSAGLSEQTVRPAVADWFYLPSWRDTPPMSAKPTPGCGHWLVAGDGNWLGEALTALLPERGDEVRQLPCSPTQDEYARLLDEMGDPERVLGIVHTGALLGPDATPAQAIERGYTSLLSLARALDGRVCSNLRLTVIADGLLDVAGESPVMPEKTMLLGPLKVLPQEYPGVACRGIDIIPALPARARDAQAREVLRELDAAWGEPLVALRGRHRWVPVYQMANPADLANGPGVRAGGVYMITGGLGGVGLVVARILAEAGARLVLVSRSGVAGREPEIIDALAWMEATADAVDIAVADVTDAEAMAAVVARTRQRFGPIIGVVHAAGETREGTVSMPLGEIGPQETAVALHARAGGLRVLDQVLAQEPVEFALAISSNAAVLGGLGLGAYAAACHCMEALTVAADAKLPWITAEWDRWPTLRSARTYTETRTSIDRYAFSQDEAATVLGWLSGRAWRGKVVVSAGDLSARLARWVNRKPGAEPSPIPMHVEPGGPSMAGTTAGAEREPAAAASAGDSRVGGAASGDVIEERLIALFHDLIGAGAIGPHDNFFEIGGDSLVGIQLIARAGQAFGVRLPVESLFEHPTVAALADCVRRLRSASSGYVGSPVLVLSDGEEEGEI